MSAHQFVFPEVFARFSRAEAPLLYDQVEDFAARRPFCVGGSGQGGRVTILHNVPLTLSTLAKLEALLAGGAALTVTDTHFVPSDPEAVSLVIAASAAFPDSLSYFSSHSACVPLSSSSSSFSSSPSPSSSPAFDIILDTCAEFLGLQSPTLGACELTLTGELRYRRWPTPLTYPVISIDASNVKRVEDAIGSADGLIRALRALVPEDIEGRRYVLFGYGKVGMGIAHRLALLSSSSFSSPKLNVTVVEADSRAVDKAVAAGYPVVLASDVAAVHAAVSACFAVVTATGVAAVISSHYNPSVFLSPRLDGGHRYLVNMGAEDEFGPGCAGAVQFDGRPVNFCLKEPTTIQYLDPAFVSHNSAAEALLGKAFDAGVHPLPESIDSVVLSSWMAHHRDHPGRDADMLSGILGKM